MNDYVSYNIARVNCILFMRIIGSKTIFGISKTC